MTRELWLSFDVRCDWKSLYARSLCVCVYVCVCVCVCFSLPLTSRSPRLALVRCLLVRPTYRHTNTPKPTPTPTPKPFSLGLDFHFLTRIHYKSYCESNDKDSSVRWGEHEIDYILVAQAEPGTKISLDHVNANEVAEARYFTREELDAFLDENLDAAGTAHDQKEKELISPWFRCIAGRGAAVPGSGGGSSEAVAGAGLGADGRGLLYTWWEDLEATKRGKWCDPKTIHRFGLVE